MKRPKISNDLTVSQGQYGKFIAYADHLEEEIERLKAERVELVNSLDRISKLEYRNASVNGCAFFAVTIATKALKQFNKEKS